MAMNVTPFQSTDEFTMAGFNGKLSDINSGVNTEITSALSGLARIETGSYVGTGTYGASNPNTLTFRFAPKLVLIYNGSKDYAMFFAFGLGGGYTSGGYLFAWSSEMAVSNDTYAKINGNVLNWYASNTSATTSRSIQFNVESQTYHYLAIG